MSKFAFRTIVVIHDNPLLPLFNDPYKQLKAAGLKPDQKVLEVGCGPGYFTIPAAKIVGESGVVYAVDLNPYAIKHVQKKIAESGIENIQPMCTNASDTGLADKSIGFRNPGVKQFLLVSLFRYHTRIIEELLYLIRFCIRFPGN